MPHQALRSVQGVHLVKANTTVWVSVRCQTIPTRSAGSTFSPLAACFRVHPRCYHQSAWQAPFTDLERSTHSSRDQHVPLRMSSSTRDDNTNADPKTLSSEHLSLDSGVPGVVHTRERTHELNFGSPQMEKLQAQRQRQLRSRRPSSMLMELLETEQSTATTSSSLVPLSADAVRWSFDEHVADVQDDDIVLDTPASLLPCMAAMGTSTSDLGRFAQGARQQRRSGDTRRDMSAPENSECAHPAARGVGQDVIDLVTDVFTAQREAEITKRRELLYDLTHPNPIDYTYKGKLVPPPPLSFGQVTAEARSLGNKMMLGQTYSLVRQAGTRASVDDFDVLGSSGNTPRGGEAISTSVSPASTIETSVSAPHSTFSPRHAKGYGDGAFTAPYRSQARAANIFRDHNYFFEINELYQEVVFVGRACAGKSSLLNRLLGQNVAKTSSLPNTTRKISFYQSVTPEQLHAFHAKERHSQLVKLPGRGLQLTFVDLPGYGIEGMSDKWRDAAVELTDAYFGVRRSVNTVLYCMDCERGLTKTDIKYLEWIENVHGTCFIVLTKCDSVPHSRICSVMRQVYSLITKHRRKYRKVFPFIIPVSARDGTNIELLRGLITETSGIIPGDKLRDLLQQQKKAFTEIALRREVARIDAARKLERNQAKEYFQRTRGGTGGAALDRGAEQAAAPLSQVVSRGDAVSAPLALGNSPHRRYVVLPLGKEVAEIKTAALISTSWRESGAVSDATDAFPTESSMATAAAEGRRERRERFLAWRRAHPLGTASPSYPMIEEEEEEEKGDRKNTMPTTAPKREEGTPDKGRYRLNTGLDNPTASHAVLELDEESCVSEGAGDKRIRDKTRARYDEGDRLASVSTGTSDAEVGGPSCFPLNETEMVSGSQGRRSSVLGLTDASTNGNAALDTGAVAVASTVPSTMSPSSIRSASPGSVSRFLDVMQQYGQQCNVVSSAKQKVREKRWSRCGSSARDRGGTVGGLMAEDASGRLSCYVAGKRSGPALVSIKTDVSRRQAEWRAEQLRGLLAKENPEAPWAALHPLRRKIQAHEEERALKGMRKKDAAAYLRDAGRVTASFEKFEGDVTAAKYMNEVRQALTLRSQQQMHLNATAKINYRSMPPGLWKRYGEKDTYWQTPQVMGRSEDESHK